MDLKIAIQAALILLAGGIFLMSLMWLAFNHENIFKAVAGSFLLVFLWLIIYVALGGK